MPVVYLDANVPLNSALEEEGSGYSTKLLEKIESGKIDSISSVITLSEASGAISRRTGNIEDAIEFGKELYAFPNLVFIPLALPLAKKAYQNAAKFKLRGMDAIHFTSALTNGADFFITLDEEFKKLVSSEIKVVSPQEFLAALSSEA